MRRRLGFVVLVLALAGCNALRDAFSAHPTAAARAAGQTLTVERLAELASRLKRMPLDQASLTRVASLYVDYVLFANALADGRTFEDTAVVARVMWPAISQMKFDRFVERLSAGLDSLTDRQIDSAYAAGDVRAFQHILLQVPPSAAPPVVRQQQAQAEQLLRQLTAAHGANFARLAHQYSDDGHSKASGGYLDLSVRGQFVPQFEEAAWQLAPGVLSGVVRSSYGFHIIRRPPLAEIRDTFATSLKRMLVSTSDSSYLANLSRDRHIRPVSRASGAVRAAMQDLPEAGRSNQRLVTFTGGEFRVRDFVRWLYAIQDPRILQGLPGATDAQIEQLLGQLTQRHVALMQAESAQVQLSDSEWAVVRTAYDSSLGQVRAVLQLSPAAFRDSAATPEARAQVVRSKVNDYLDRLVAGQAPFVQVPPLLAQVLRERGPWSLDQAAIRGAAEQAVALRAHADSLRPPGAGSPGAAMRPAPGPAPVPDSLTRSPSSRVVQ